MKDKLTPHEKLQLQRLIDKMPTTTRCVDCRNYDCGMCQLASEMIPQEVLETGCEQWDFDPNSPPF